MVEARQIARIAAVATAIVAIAALVAVLTAGAGAAGLTAKPRTCRDVVVRFQPEGSGGATQIRAKRIGCRGARSVIRACIGGKLRPGWSGRFVDPKFLLVKGERRIRYLPVGGGGCLPV